MRHALALSFGVRFALIAIAIFWVGHGRALELPAQATQVDLATQVEVLEDPSGSLTLDDVTGPAYKSQFRRWTATGDVHLGFTSSAYWLRVSLQRAPGDPRHWLLEVPYAQISSINFHAPGALPVRTGSMSTVWSRPVFHRFFAFPVEPSEQAHYFYLRVSSVYALSVPLVAWEANAFNAHLQMTMLVQSLYYGELLALMVYNLFLFWSLRDARFFFYAVFAGFFCMGIFAGNGLGMLFLWPNYPDFDAISQSAFLSAAGAFAVLFSRSFFKVGNIAPVVNRLLQLSALSFFWVASLLLASLLWTVPLAYVFHSLMVTGLVTAGLILIASVQALRMGLGGTRIFLLAWGLLWMGVTVASLRAYGWVPTNLFTSYSLQISSAAEILLLSLALAHMVRAEREAREIAQQEALQANRLLVETLQVSEEKLEHEVMERTARLESSLARQMEMLAQYTRFSSLVSHEFRNPLAIIDSQLSLLKKELARGINQIDKRILAMTHAVRRLSVLLNHWQKGDHLDDILPRMHLQPLKVHPWLRQLLDDSASLLASHQLECRFAAEVESVAADIDLLEMAVLNLLDNACKYAPAGSLIVVETCRDVERIGIAVIDQGPGIAADQHANIFSEYFRVAPESQTGGMGLGLYLVQKIMAAHAGSVELRSEPGQGSRFCIWLKAGA